MIQINFNFPVYGLTSPSVLAGPLEDEGNDRLPTIGIEARKLRALLLRLMEYN